jgi:hypothetical protein
MIETGDHPSLAEIELGAGGAGDAPCLRHFDRDVTMQFLVVSKVHDAESA